jgi:hypothetical protein
MIALSHYNIMNRITGPSQPFRIEAQLGNPQAECRGFGICTIDEISADQWQHYRPYRIRRAKALVSWCDDRLLFSFPTNGMLVPCRAHFFASGHFLLESALDLPEWICAPLGIEQLRIPAGLFACTLREESFSVELPLETAANFAVLPGKNWKQAV